MIETKKQYAILCVNVKYLIVRSAMKNMDY